MPIKITQKLSPNYDQEIIPLEFVIIHHTGVNLVDTLNIFTQPNSVSAHLVIDQDGTTYECVPCWNVPPLKAWHAGVSKLERQGKLYESFNKFALGIELVNFNGNFFEYTTEQYDSLKSILDHFTSRFPILLESERIIGHEHIAGFRGKCDPGLLFEWHKILPVAPSAIYKQYHWITGQALYKKLKDIYTLLPVATLFQQSELTKFLSGVAELTFKTIIANSLGNSEQLDQQPETMQDYLDKQLTTIDLSLKTLLLELLQELKQQGQA